MKPLHLESFHRFFGHVSSLGGSQGWSRANEGGQLGPRAGQAHLLPCTESASGLCGHLGVQAAYERPGPGRGRLPSFCARSMIDPAPTAGPPSPVGNELETRCRVWRRGRGVAGTPLPLHPDPGVVRAPMEDSRAGVLRLAPGTVGLSPGPHGQTGAGTEPQRGGGDVRRNQASGGGAEGGLSAPSLED